MWETPSMEKLQEAIASPNSPIGMRMRAAYFLRQSYETAKRNRDPDNNDDDNENNDNEDDVESKVIETLGRGLMEEQHGSLMRHEFAYVMGQLRDTRCCPYLEQTLSNTNDCIMVRHECGEALGAIGSPSSIPILQQAVRLNPDSPEIGQTCEIAIEYMAWKNRQKNKKNVKNDSDANLADTNNNTQQQQHDDDEQKEEEEEEEPPMACACMINPYSSIDPAPPHPHHANLTTYQIGQILHDDKLPLFKRYRAMFSLRNRGGSDAVRELGKALVEDTSSALLRHEVAYVLGQMQDEVAMGALEESLGRRGENAMVRHESAEALGAIEVSSAEKWGEVERILKKFLEDDDIVVRESCLVALDAADYWGHSSSGGDATGGDVVGEEEQEGSSKGGDDNEGEEKKDGNTPLSFVQQKAVTNGANNNPVLNNHFNLAY